MENLKSNNIPVLSAGKCIETLTFMYSQVVKNNIEFSKMPSVMLWGPPGVGKSQAVKAFAKEMEQLTSKKVNVTDVRLLLFNPIDLRGIPTANEDKTLAVWLKPKIFQMDPSYNVINILFLDEITAAPQSVQAAAYQITLDRTVGEHKLPDNCIVIAAGNRTTDKSVAYAMPKALANRLLHLEVEPNFASWNKWAVGNGINPKVLGFLKFKPNYLIETDIKTSTLAYATPRTWEMVSDVLNNVSADIKDVYHLVAGLVGKGIAVEFRSWCSIYEQLPDIESIFKGRYVEVPKRPDVLYALISSMLTYAKLHKDDLVMIENSINYAMKLSPEFSTILLKDYLYIEKDYQKRLLRIPAFSKWLSSKGRLLDELN
jgi:DNA polymerase III delta prime subunit